MTAKTIVWKTLHNATRCFDVHMSVRQAKAMKKLIKGICVHGTTVLQRLYTKESKITANKFRESLSYHLEHVDLNVILELKAKRLITKTQKYKWFNLIAGDASDIFKPHAQAMQGISVVRDGSTWQIGNGFVIYGININGITHQVEIKDPSIEYIWSEKREIMLKKTALVVDPKSSIGIFDRWHDDVGFIDMLQSLDYHFVVRWKKNRIVTIVETGKEVKVWSLKCGRYYVRLEWGTYAYVYIVKWSRRNPVILYSDIEFEMDEECLEIYKKRRRIELDYAKMKSFGLEDVRLMSLRKVSNIMKLIQFIVMLWQDLYNEITERVKAIPIALAAYYKDYCRRTRKTMNPSSLLSFISENIIQFSVRNPSKVPRKTLFWSSANMKKLGLI